MPKKLKDTKVKCRLIQTHSGLYVGELYYSSDEKDLIENFKCNALTNGWNEITESCFTKLGCKLAIRHWKKRHYIEHIEI